MGQDFITLARIEARNLDPGEALIPAGYNCLLCGGAIGPTVYQHCNAKPARGPRKGGELVTTAGVRDLREVSAIGEGAQFRFRCTVESFDYLYVHLARLGMPLTWGLLLGAFTTEAHRSISGIYDTRHNVRVEGVVTWSGFISPMPS